MINIKTLTSLFLVTTFLIGVDAISMECERDSSKLTRKQQKLIEMKRGKAKKTSADKAENPAKESRKPEAPNGKPLKSKSQRKEEKHKDKTGKKSVKKALKKESKKEISFSLLDIIKFLIPEDQGDEAVNEALSKMPKKKRKSLEKKKSIKIRKIGSAINDGSLEATAEDLAGLNGFKEAGLTAEVMKQNLIAFYARKVSEAGVDPESVGLKPSAS